MLEIITNIIADRVKRNRSPAYALYEEILREADKQGKNKTDIKKELRALLNAGKIELGRTLNDHWIKVK